MRDTVASDSPITWAKARAVMPSRSAARKAALVTTAALSGRAAGRVSRGISRLFFSRKYNRQIFPLQGLLIHRLEAWDLGQAQGPISLAPGGEDIHGVHAR